MSDSNALIAPKFGDGLKNQILCKESVDGASSFSIKTLAVNAGAAVGGWFFGNKLLSKWFPKAKGFLNKGSKGGSYNG